jgi:hypothetical protein
MGELVTLAREHGFEPGFGDSVRGEWHIEAMPGGACLWSVGVSHRGTYAEVWRMIQALPKPQKGASET